MSNEPDWARLGDAVRRRRERLGLTQQDVASKGGPSTATMRQIEGALADGYRAKTLYTLDDALDWDRGTCIGIAEGEPPFASFETLPEWMERVIRDVSRQIRTGADFPVGKQDSAAPAPGREPVLSVVPSIVAPPEDDNEVLAAIHRDPHLSAESKAHFLNQYQLLRELSARQAGATREGGPLPYVAHGQRTTPVDQEEERRLEEIARDARRRNLGDEKDVPTK